MATILKEGPIRKMLRERNILKHEQVTVEEMRHALIGMTNLLSIVTGSKGEMIFEAFMYSAKVTMKQATERRAFIQDLAAALNRRYLLSKEDADTFSKLGYIYMEA